MSWLGTTTASTAADYLNVNVPSPDRALAGLAIIHLTPQYDVYTDLADGRFALHNPLHAAMAKGEIPDDDGTVRRALLKNRVSFSPLALPRSGIDEAVYDRLGELFADMPDAKACGSQPPSGEPEPAGGRSTLPRVRSQRLSPYPAFRSHTPSIPSSRRVWRSTFPVELLGSSSLISMKRGIFRYGSCC